MFDGAIFPTPQERALRRAYERLVQRHEHLDMSPDAHDPRVQSELDRVRTALSWFVVGLYGRCCVCGVDLETSQLDQDPADMACDDCESSARVSGACLR
jgi:RNA polymerase-binding transcription factor DksA